MPILSIDSTGSPFIHDSGHTLTIRFTDKHCRQPATIQHIQAAVPHLKSKATRHLVIQAAAGEPLVDNMIAKLLRSARKENRSRSSEDKIKVSYPRRSA